MIALSSLYKLSTRTIRLISSDGKPILEGNAVDWNALFNFLNNNIKRIESSIRNSLGKLFRK
jgi:hypothetical protein